MHDKPQKGAAWPRFSLATLLYLCACVAVSLAVAAEQPVADYGFSFYQPRVELRDALWSFATLGLATVLVQQAGVLRRRHAFFLAAWCRIAVAFSLAVLLTICMLMRRRVIVTPEPNFNGLLIEVFPGAMWLVMIVIAASVATGRRRRPARWQIGGGGLACLLVVAGITYLLFIAAEVSTVSFLVHVACDGMESIQPTRFQRQEVYPDHVAEGFLTYRLTTAAVGVLLVTVVAVLVLYYSSLRWVKAVAVVGVACGLAALVGYNAWYYSVEYPRVSPELAVSGLALGAVDLFAGGVLFCVLTLWLSASLTESRQRPGVTHTLSYQGPLSMAPAVFAAIAMIVAGGIAVAEAAYIATTDYYAAILGVAPKPFLDRLADGVVTLLRSPTFLLDVVMISLGVVLASRLWRREEPVVSRLPIGALVRMWLLAALIALVGVPTLAAWGFSSWLGPWWR